MYCNVLVLENYSAKQILLQMCSCGPARVYALKHMTQHSSSTFSSNNFRVLNIVCTPPNSCLKTDKYHIFSIFRFLIFLGGFFSAEMKHQLVKTILHTILGTTWLKSFIFLNFLSNLEQWALHLICACKVLIKNHNCFNF